LSPDRILIADADAKLRDSLSRVLQEKGFAIGVSSTGQETLRIAREEKPSLIILELLMTDMPGEEICRTLKNEGATKGIPIIVLTLKDHLQSKLKCLEYGVEEYLVKPVEPEELVARMSRLFRLLENRPHQSRPSMHSDITENIADRTRPTINIPNDVPPEVPVAGAIPASGKKPERSSYGVYRVESVAGVGGMGIVYKAYDQSLDRYTAVKVLSKEWSDSPEVLERFRREAKLIAALNHPGIAQIYTFATEEGDSFFALQWCPGGSVANLIRSREKLDLLPAIEIVEQCARALEVASSKGIVHRDIKPSNLMFDENQQVKIVDFGISFSKLLPEQLEQSSQVIGSPAYMSPEQGQGRAADHRTDIYSMGITFYQMLYGRLPYKANSPMEYLRQHAKDPFPAYDSLEGKIPRKAYKIIEKMTQKLPVSRYQKYADLIKDLEQLRRELYGQRHLKIPSIEEISPQPLFTGNNLFELLTDIFRNEKSGLLKVSWGSLEKKFLIVRNELVHFESPQPDENVWAALLTRKLLKKEDTPSNREDLEESLNRLLYLGAVTPEDFKTVYRELMLQSILQVFLWPVFEGRFHAGRIEHAPLARIPLARIMMKAARSILPIEDISGSIPKDQRIVRAPGSEEHMKLFNFSRDEAFLISRNEGPNNTLHTLELLTGLPSEEVARIVYALERFGVLKYETPVKRRPRSAGRATIAAGTNETPRIKFEKTEVVEQQASASLKIEEIRRDGPVQPREWIDAAPGPNLKSAAKSYKQAQEKYKGGHFWETIRLCGSAISNNPNEATYHYLMALALMNFPHSVSAAVESFRHAIQLDPENVEYRLQLVTFLKDKSQYKDAHLECELLLQIAPTNHKAAVLMRTIELER